MKKPFVFIVLLLSAFFVEAQSSYYYDYGYQKNTFIHISGDVLFPFGDFASSSYRLAEGADQYDQEGTFSPSFGGSIGVEVVVSNNFSLRPKVELASLKGNHYVGGFDSPKMVLVETRPACDLMIYFGRMKDIYIFGTAGYSIEKLTVNRILFKERFNSQRVTAGGGIGYVFGFEKNLFVEASYLQSVSGAPPCSENFPELQITKVSLGIRF